MILAYVRASAAELPLFIHVLGAMLMLGSLFTIALASGLAWKRADGATGITRLGFKTVLWALLPSYILMRAGAGWVESKEGLEDADLNWLAIGSGIADTGFLLVLVSVVLSVVGLRKLRSGQSPNLLRATGILAAVFFIACLVAVWAMATKPV